jgi:hypothetical protein
MFRRCPVVVVYHYHNRHRRDGYYGIAFVLPTSISPTDIAINNHESLQL